MTSLDTPLSRRNAFKIGGLAVTVGALAAACGENRGGSEELGRVGNAETPEPLPTYEVDDLVLLRTASSLEYTAIEVYETALGLEGAVPDSLVPLMERLVENHQMVADEMVALTEANGGTGWECANPWFMDRLVGPVLDLIQSNVVGVVQEDTSMVQVKGEILPIGDTVTTSVGDLQLVSDVGDLSEGDEIEFTRLDGAVSEDIVTFAIGLENLATAAHQVLASATSILDARAAHVEASQLEARQGSKLAIEVGKLRDELPYIGPELLGEEPITTPTGQIRKYAVESTFGQTAQIEIKAGPADLNNVRESIILQTPAANSFVYNELEPTCDA